MPLDEKLGQLRTPGEWPEEGSECWQVRWQIREVLQRAVVAGLAHLEMVQKGLVEFGAIPDPNEGRRKYFCDQANGYKCWQCGASILGKRVAVSIHFDEFPGPVGGGEVENSTVPYCPNCDKEPAAHDIRVETLAESLAREAPPS